jgi:hypothetical protein
LKSYCTDDFWKLFDRLPAHVQKQADIAYKRFKRDPAYPSLQFKCIDRKKQTYSARVGISYRVVGQKRDDTILWYWIGSHEDYNHLLSGR